ncbi:MAG: D-alanine--D-alanine ligase, partial [Oscillospiraceae bacterium]
MSKLNVAVIFGGCSSEYEVSLMSAASVLENMPGDFCDCIRIGITRDGRWYCTDASFDEIKNDTWLEKNCVPCFLSPDRGMRAVVKLLPDGSYETCGVDVVFPVLHGKNGEDGTIQGLFELAGIPYVGCDVLSSAVCMDKVVTNMLLERFGVKRAAWGLITKNEFESFEKYAENWEAV